MVKALQAEFPQIPTHEIAMAALAAYWDCLNDRSELSVFDTAKQLLLKSQASSS